MLWQVHSLTVQLSWSFDRAVDFVRVKFVPRTQPSGNDFVEPATIFLSHWVSQQSQKQRFFFPFEWSSSNSRKEWKIRNGNSVSRNSHRRWWRCVQNYVVFSFFFCCFSGRLTVDCKIKRIQRKAKKQVRAANEIQRINKYNCFLSDGTHLNLFSGLTSWLASKSSFFQFRGLLEHLY